jgi:hypothetical protein
MIRNAAAPAAAADSWERGRDGAHLTVPVSPRDIDAIRRWLSANCEADFLIVLGPQVMFQRAEDAALAALF